MKSDIVLTCVSYQSYYIKEWDMLVNFKVHGESDTLFQGGFAFWYSKERMQEGIDSIFLFCN